MQECLRATQGLSAKDRAESNTRLISERPSLIPGARSELRRKFGHETLCRMDLMDLMDKMDMPH